MTGKLNFKLVALCAILTAMMAVPASGQAKDEWGEKFKERKIQMIKALKLAPDKEKAMLAVEDKFAAQRREVIAALKKSQDELQAALAAANPDEAKVKALVSALTGGQDSLFNSFQSQRNEELALMTPIEQGKYLLALGKWRQEMMTKGKEKAGKGKK